ncbi:hypothetical protein CYY_001974 [Polysphondylium violaceum]|uniref:Right handed beta helix domain-containing protein n=1 Tax=Polysphondylium violaceum TaxID=133409 RepID=A0A8J4Q0Y9_9MYCE|nr:hypothetical protein CYY_001974 [Polysphondylium violaceum]
MKLILSLLFFLLFVCNCVYSDNSLTLYVDPSNGSVDTRCGTTLQNSCKTFLLAYQSYSRQTDGTNTTALILSLVDGIYKAADNDSTSLNPFFQYLQPGNHDLKIIITKITFVNSYYIVNSIYGADVRFVNCVFTNSTAKGGLVNIIGGSFHLLNSLISEIKVPFNAIDIKDYSSALIENVTVSKVNGRAVFSVENSNVEFRNLLLTNSHADSAPILISSSNVIVSKSTFTYNSGYKAGALYIFQEGISRSTLVDASKFTHNQTPQQAGAIFHFTESNTKDINIIQNSIFDSNNASGDGFDRNYVILSNGLGGALFLEGGSVSIRNCSFDTNSASNAGGAIFSHRTKVYIDHSPFNDNTSLEGGAIYSLKTWFYLTDSPYNGNYASLNGTNFLCRNSTVDIQAVDAITNDGYYCPVQDCSFSTTPSHNFICPPEISSGYKNNTPLSTISFFVFSLSFFLLSLLF